jgi:hypothetical protein
MKTASLAIALAVFLACAASALAAPVTYDITGTVTYSGGSFTGDAGDALTAVLTEELSAANGSVVSPGSVYLTSNLDPDLLAMTLTVNGQTLTVPPINSSDNFQESIEDYSNAANGGLQSTYQALLLDFTTGGLVQFREFSPGGSDSAYTSTGLVPLVNSNYNIAVIQTRSDEVDFNVNSIALRPSGLPVPAPFSLGLLGLGLAAVGFRRRAVIKG